MKRICALLFVLAVFAGTAAAEVREFSKLSINIPEGWSAEEIAGTVAAIKDDKTASYTVSVEPFTDGHNLAEMAQIYSQSFKGTAPAKAANGSYLFLFNEGNTQAIISASAKGTSYVLVTMTGLMNAPDDFKSMASSMVFKQ